MPKRGMLSRRKGSIEEDAPQRLWRGISVDKNLRNSWLVALNSLQMFELISICEGHWNSNMRMMDSPHVNLRWKDVESAPYLLYELVDGLDDDFLTGDFKVESTIRASVDPYRRKHRFCDTDAVISFTSRRTLAYEGMGEDKVKWFRGLIRRIKTLDLRIFLYLKSLDACHATATEAFSQAPLST